MDSNDETDGLELRSSGTLVVDDVVGEISTTVAPGAEIFVDFCSMTVIEFLAVAISRSLLTTHYTIHIFTIDAGNFGRIAARLFVVEKDHSSQFPVLHIVQFVYGSFRTLYQLHKYIMGPGSGDELML
uniref:Uncharacterized protein n=1 Tax=Romanomermis culicivorax TaxID=13658 RepID=A0A915KN45_ROMCU